MNRVILGDCMDFMATCKDNEFDLGIVDPPYGIGASTRADFGKVRSKSAATETNNYLKKQWDNSTPDKKYFDELFRISKNQIIWGVNYYPLDLTGGRIFWDKGNPETYSKSAGELAFKSIGYGIDYVKIIWNGMIQQDMKNKETRIHPTQKPVALYKWLLTNYATAGQTIFDSHVGSGSSRIACHDLGYDFTGCELDADYHASQEERYKRHIAQQPLFEPEELRQPEQTSLFEDESCN